jgi:hypothetical protein
MPTYEAVNGNKTSYGISVIVDGYLREVLEANLLLTSGVSTHLMGKSDLSKSKPKRVVVVL